MSPRLKSGDRVIATPYRGEQLQRGTVVLLSHPMTGQRMIKRLSHPCQGGWWVLGDNPTNSSDSRQFGAVAATAIEAIATAVVPSKRPSN
jgi:nickel-type superoxide dismutase maturation protease